MNVRFLPIPVDKSGLARNDPMICDLIRRRESGFGKDKKDFHCKKRFLKRSQKDPHLVKGRGGNSKYHVKLSKKPG